MSNHSTQDSFSIVADDGNTAEFLQVDTDCRLTIYNGRESTSVLLPSIDIVDFIIWTLPPRAIDILRESGLELGKVY